MPDTPKRIKSDLTWDYSDLKTIKEATEILKKDNQNITAKHTTLGERLVSEKTNHTIIVYKRYKKDIQP